MSFLKNTIARAAQWRRAILFAAVALLIFVVYWRLLPKMWPTPNIIIKPAGNIALPADGKLKLKVTVKAWHQNTYLSQVRFEGDWMTSTSLSPKELLPVVVPFKGHDFDETILDHWTKPFSRTYDIEIPVGEMINKPNAPALPLKSEIIAVARYPLMNENRKDEDFNTSRRPWVTTVKTENIEITK